VFEKASKANTPEIADLNHDQASQRPKKLNGKPVPDQRPNALDENECDHGQQRSDAKDRSSDQAGKSMKRDCGYQIRPRRWNSILGAKRLTTCKSAWINQVFNFRLK
jgi:hypothetical protein